MSVDVAVRGAGVQEIAHITVHVSFSLPKAGLAYEDPTIMSGTHIAEWCAAVAVRRQVKLVTVLAHSDLQRTEHNLEICIDAP